MHTCHNQKLLGDWTFSWQPFDGLDSIIDTFTKPSFQKEDSRKRFKEVNKTLLLLIQKHATPCFLLPQVLDYIHHINTAKILDEVYTLFLFEFWLNNFSKINAEDNILVRSKIAGRHLPRNEYQNFFPVGLGKTLPGSHFVAAHLSPDIDTAVASFWGWLDAFSCRLSEGLHYWSLPKGLSDGHIKKFFKKSIHPSFFEVLPKPDPTLSVTALDLITQKDSIKVPLNVHADSINHGEEGNLAIVLVDEKGMYQGDWRSQDAEATRQVIDTAIVVLRWFKNTLITRLIAALAKDPVSQHDLASTIDDVLKMHLKECDAITEMADRSKKQLQSYMKRLFRLSSSFSHTIEELLLSTNALFPQSFNPALQLFQEIHHQKNSQKPLLHIDAMKWLERIVSTVKACVQTVRNEAKTLKHLLLVKKDVLEYPSTFVTLKSDVDEMLLKIRGLDHLTVVIPEKADALFPVGIVRARDLQKSLLGTASLRDFSNLEETKSASYIDVASIIDHHKANIKTSAASTMLLSDAQSTNTLLAEATLQMNSAFQQTLQGKSDHSPYWVSKERELLEYLSELYAILDDTDLLSKVSKRDLTIVVHLLNRMKSLIEHAEWTPIALAQAIDTYAQVKIAAQQLLQNKELHSIYKKVYQHKETEIEETLQLAAERKPSTIFSDTKVQNGCCKIGQTKLFESNLPTFKNCLPKILSYWVDQSIETHQKDASIDFFLHMISTIPGEAEVMQGGPSWKHLDELWITVAEGDIPMQHLISFLNNFNFSETTQNMSMHVEIQGIHAHEIERLVRQNLTRAHDIKRTHEKISQIILIIRFAAGSINSRKTQISPFLPKLVG